jgi:UDP-N-acetyl-2-amino-2-deoxyglucuronate dehydrogenase
MNPIGFGIVGLGMGHERAKWVVKTEGARLVAVCDLNPERVQRSTTEFGCEGYTDFKKMLRRKDLDVVMVMTPSGTHADFAVAAARRGKHVITTKPMEVTLKRCDRMIAAAEKAGVKLAVDFELRFYPPYRWIKAAIEAGEFGKLIFGEARCKWFRTQGYYDQGGWRGTWKMDGGGALANQSVHVIDALLHLMGRPVEVYAQCATVAHTIETEDLGLAMIHFENGARGMIVGTTTLPGGTEFGVEVHGEQGGGSTLRTRYASEETQWFFSGDKKQPNTPLPQGPKNVIEDFVACISENRAPFITGQEGRRSIELLTAIYKSSRKRKAVKL